MFECTKIIAMALHVATLHSEPGYENFNPGVSAQLDCNIAAGIYRNSEGRPSVFGGYVFEKQYDRVTPFLLVGAVTGYEDWPVAPLVSPGVAVRVTDSVSVRFSYIPGGFNDLPHGIHFSLSKQF